MDGTSKSRAVSVVLFEGFELLDMAGPIEVFGQLPERFEVSTVAPARGAVGSAQGIEILAGHDLAGAPRPDIVLVPGGIGTRRLVHDEEFLTSLLSFSAAAKVVAAVCTGSALLAAAGLLDGYRATSNKRSFTWVTSQRGDVSWQPEARWVEDRDRWTSSGVAAGIDMALALVGALCGEEVATEVADRIEYHWHRDPKWDPFAAKNGLTR